MARPTWDKSPRTTKKLPELAPAQAKTTVKAAEKAAAMKKPASPKAPAAPKAPKSPASPKLPKNPLLAAFKKGKK